jgi:hypothetical protein
MHEQLYGTVPCFVLLVTKEEWPLPLTVLRGHIEQDYDQQGGDLAVQEQMY